ncbi:hypothetical protein [Fretibacter rubidus]|uniref:hypothetical protein n=1 Tax=Fretibacter rubidus TaxID=570162 RepID=UPI00352B4C92
MRSTIIKVAAAALVGFALCTPSFAQDAATPTAPAASVLDQFQDFEITSAVTADPSPFSRGSAQPAPTVLPNMQNTTTPQLTDTDMRLLGLDTQLSDGESPNDQEFEAIKDSIAIKNPTAKPKSKIERFKPEFQIRTNDDVIEIK